jgi:hypothetical protein
MSRQPPTCPQGLTYVGLCFHIVWCNKKVVGERETLKIYLNSASKNTSETNLFLDGTKSLLTSVIGKVGWHISCRNCFKGLNILPLSCIYIREVVCCFKSNLEKMKFNEEVHDHCTRQKSDLHTQYCVTTLLKSVVKMWVLNCSINCRKQ